MHRTMLYLRLYTEIEALLTPPRAVHPSNAAAVQRMLYRGRYTHIEALLTSPRAVHPILPRKTESPHRLGMEVVHDSG